MSTDSALSYGTLDTQASTAGIESQAGVTMAMFELNWASFEPRPGVVSASYLATMRSYLRVYRAAGQLVTLGPGLQNPPPERPLHQPSAAGMMASALRQARSCKFTVFYWAHDVHLWDGTIPFTQYAAMIADQEGKRESGHGEHRPL
jgi:hypothetical protein